MSLEGVLVLLEACEFRLEPLYCFLENSLRGKTKQITAVELELRRREETSINKLLSVCKNLLR
jgi:hypothetical protein